MLPLHALGQLCEPGLHHEERHAKDADRLPEQHAQVRAHRDGIHHERAQVDAHEPHLSVHEREDGQDDEIDRRRDAVLQALKRRA